MITDLDTGVAVAQAPFYALKWFDRLRGMIGRKFRPGELDAMVFFRCNAVHSFWMTIPIDLLFLDRTGEVTAVKRDYRPWRWPAVCRKAMAVIELPAGTIAAKGVKIGHHLDLNFNLSEKAVEKIKNSSMVMQE